MQRAGYKSHHPTTLRNHFQMGDVCETLWWVRRVSLARERGAELKKYVIENKQYGIIMMGCDFWWLSRIIMQPSKYVYIIVVIK